MSPRERAALLARFAASEGELEAYADALAVTDELEAGERAAAEDGARIIPLASARRRAGWGARARLALAASVTAVAIGAAAWGVARGRGEAADPGRFAALLGTPGLPAGWRAEPWTAVRAPDEVLDRRARAVRAGARITDLEAAAAAGDSAAVRRAAADLGSLLASLPASGPATAVYDELARRAGEPPGALAALRERGRRTAARLAGEEAVALGAWAEAARLAAARRTRTFSARAPAAARWRAPCATRRCPPPPARGWSASARPSPHRPPPTGRWSSARRRPSWRRRGAEYAHGSPEPWA
jgi:hypothetical protein